MRETFVFSPDTDKNTGQYRNRIFITPRRAGLTTRVKEHGQDVHIGSMLNEFSTYYIQKLFIDSLKDQEIFTEELRTNEQNVRNHIDRPVFTVDEDTVSFDIVLEEKNSRVRVDKANLHFDRQDQSPLKKISTYFTQIATDLIKLCGTVDVDGKIVSVGDLLVEAKINPMVANTLQATIDSHMGKGFYKKLSNTNDDFPSLVKLLTAIQSKLYPTTPS